MKIFKEYPIKSGEISSGFFGFTSETTNNTNAFTLISQIKECEIIPSKNIRNHLCQSAKSAVTKMAEW